MSDILCDGALLYQHASRRIRVMGFLDSDRISDTMVNVCLAGTCLVFVLFIILPIMSVFMNLSLSRLILELESGRVIDALTVGLLTSFLSTMLALVFGVPTAYLLATRRFVGKPIVETILDLPMVLPPAVAGMALLLAFAPRGILGPTLRGLGIILPGSTLAVVLSQFFVASPFILRSTKVAFENVQKSIIDSARILSPSRIRIFFTVTLALSTHGVVSGIVMTWARSMGEFGATLMFAGNLPGVTQTMPLAIYTLMVEDPLASNILSAILVVVSFFVLALFRLLGRKRSGIYYD